MRDNIDMSLVFKLTSVQDLGRLHKALKTALTFQEEIKLKGEVMKLRGNKARLESELEGLKAEIRVLSPGKDIKLEKTNEDEKKETDVAEEEDTEAGIVEFEPDPAQDSVAEEPSYIQEETEENRTLEA